MISMNRLLLVASMVLLLAGCEEKPRQTATPQPLANGNAEIPDASPDPASAKNLVTENTREVYQWYCTQCHGVKGKGDGINARLLTVPPRDHTKADYLETRTDQQLFDAIKLGGLAVGRAPCMPSWEHTLDEGTIHSLVRYIRELCQCEAI